MKKVITIFVVMVVLVGCGVEGEIYCGDGTVQAGDTCVVAEAKNVNLEIEKEESDIPVIKCGEGTILDKENDECIVIANDDDDDTEEVVCGEGHTYYYFWEDKDNDGYGDPLGVAKEFCVPIGDVSIHGWGHFPDCDDNDEHVHPGAVEICDGIDNDCDEEIDEDDPHLGKACHDLLCQGPDNLCTPIRGLLQCALGELSCFPNCVSDETSCDNFDNDCDGEIDEGCEEENDLYFSLSPDSPSGTLVPSASTTVLDFVITTESENIRITQLQIEIAGTCGLLGEIKVKDRLEDIVAGPLQAAELVIFTDAINIPAEEYARFSVLLNTIDCTDSQDWIQISIIDVSTKEPIGISGLPLKGNILQKP